MQQPPATKVLRLCKKPGLTGPPAERPAADTGEYIGTCECRLSSLLCGPRLNNSAR